MDICTLVIIATINTMGCGMADQCEVRDGKQYCIPAHAIACPMPSQYWECKRPDGTSYQEPYGAK